MKKIMAMAVAFVMCLTMAVPAMAAGTNSITVNGTKEGETLTIFKMFDLSVDDESKPEAFTYTVNSAWTDFFTTGDGKDYVTISDNDGHVTWKEGMDTEAKMIELGQKAAAAAVKIGGGTAKTAEGESVVFDKLDPGYYLITSTLGTKAIIDTTPTDPAPAINEKNPEDSSEKNVKEDDTGEYGKENDAQVGDKVEYRTDVTLNPYTRNVKLHDTMTEGLTFNNDISIEGLTAGEDYTVETPGKDEEGTATTFTVTFTEEYLKSIEPDPASAEPQPVELAVIYSATLNEKAVTSDPAIAVQENRTHLSFGDKQKSTEDKTTTTTYKFAINKFAKAKENLADALFSVKRNGTVQTLVMIDAQNYRIATAEEIKAAGEKIKKFDDSKTVGELALAAGDVTEYLITTAAGDIVVWGVDSDDNDTYTLDELKAPKGYNDLEKEVTVKVEDDNSTVVDVENQTGTELPSTGGIGTMIFYVIGAVLVAAAGIILVTRRKSHE